MDSEEFSQENGGLNISKFDSTIAHLIRLDMLWKKSNEQSQMGKFTQWNVVLDTIWRELSQDTKEGCDEEQKIDKINAEIIKSKTNSINFYNALSKKEIYLRRLQQKQGKGTGYKDSFDDYMD